MVIQEVKSHCINFFVRYDTLCDYLVGFRKPAALIDKQLRNQHLFSAVINFPAINMENIILFGQIFLTCDCTQALNNISSATIYIIPIGIIGNGKFIPIIQENILPVVIARDIRIWQGSFYNKYPWTVILIVMAQQYLTLESFNINLTKMDRYRFALFTWQIASAYLGQRFSSYFAY